MKPTKFTKIALAATLAGAVALPASGAFAASRKTENALLGAVIGGVAGGVIGDGKGSSVALGAVAGAAIGAATTKDKRRYHRSYNSRPAYNSYAYRNNDRRDRGYYNAGYRQAQRDYDRYGYYR
jgi:uncharacterized protein YcfJ